MAGERPARIRVTEDSAVVLLDLIDREIRRCLTSRGEMRGAALDILTKVYNERLRILRDLDDELERTGVEEGWWQAQEVAP